MSKSEENKALVRYFLQEAWSKGNVAIVDKLLAPDFVDRSLLPGQGSSREEYKRSAAKYYAAFSLTDFTIEYQIAEGDMVVTKFSTRSIHRGEFLGVPPSGEVGEYSSIRIHRIAGGKITDEWSEGSLLKVLLPSFEREIRTRERIEQDLRVARRIQQASLPKEVPTLEGWKISPYYQPAREVGGDFYDFLELDDGCLGIVVGDATGKGVPAALVMASARSMLRALAQNTESPADALRMANDSLVNDIPSNMFITCFYCVLDPESGRLLYANAGHDLPYLRRRGGEREELRARGMPLGLMPGMSYEEEEIEPDVGEGVFFYSDGLVEAHAPKGEMFGFPRLRRLIAHHSEEERSLGEFLMEELYSFVGEGWEQEDDITLLTLRRS